ncbi:hypothetical protein BCR34DRAFT_606952 [Clohesyomyces aquaticus]|uniref:Uncharacterized protein n=1 Tax=Clohesyomyces aquaticus TaxID=1231657 RepID=A0A1Y1YK10_9PLEO|nr:hypothetical protein BCR34DRAFT_606952 [Clohesyomyces aquaticus]
MLSLLSLAALAGARVITRDPTPPHPHAAVPSLNSSFSVRARPNPNPLPLPPSSFSSQLSGIHPHRPRLILPRTKVRRFEISDEADDALWNSAICKGTQMVAGLKGSDKDAATLLSTGEEAEAEWQGDLKAERATWYWFDLHGELSGSNEFESMWRNTHIMDALDLSYSRKDNVVFGVEHGDRGLKDDKGQPVSLKLQTYKVGDVDYKATGGYYKGVINTKGGVIFSQYLMSPSQGYHAFYGGPLPPPKGKLPRLRTYSQLLWGFWFRDNPNVKNIQYFWVQSVANDDTHKIIARALKGKGKDAIGGWPGTVFDILREGKEGEAGRALLGSPPGATNAFFLMQHRKELGQKLITKVAVFIGNEEVEDDEGEDPDLLFWVEDAPESDGGVGGRVEGNGTRAKL